MNRLLCLAAHASVWLAPTITAALAQPLPWPARDATHRAIFCGRPGHAETTRDYAEALLAELRRLEAAGLASVEAWARLRQQAACAEAPAPPARAPR